MPTTEYRQVATRAKIIDDNMNSWEDFAGADINVEVAYRYPVGSGPDETAIDHWSYRGQAAMCKLGNGNIVRVRIGDGSTSNKNVYIQIITDPSDPDAWTNWSLKYAADNYAIAIEADPIDPANYFIYTSQAGGLFINNVLKTPFFNKVVRIKPVAFTTAAGFLFVQSVVTDDDGFRAMLWSYTTNIFNPGASIWFGDVANNRQYRNDIVCLKGSDSNHNLWHKFRAWTPEAGGRNQAASQILTLDTVDALNPLNDTQFNIWRNARYLKGPSGQGGFQTISNLYVTKLPDSSGDLNYFLFYNERQRDILGNTLSNLKMPLFWSLAAGVYPYYMSAPTPVGYSIWGFAGAVQSGNYIYLAGNGRVLRRSWPMTEISIENYILDGGYNKPRGNEKATGKLTCANPNNVLGSQLGLTSENTAGLTGRRLWLEIGKKLLTDNTPQWKRDSAWWISDLKKSKSDNKQHLEINFADFWDRLENPFLDTITLPGHFRWEDWNPGGVNQLYNWYNDTDELFRYNPVVTDDYLWTNPRLRTLISGDGPLGGGTVTLLQTWRGENGYVQAVMWNINVGIVFRYQDSENFLYVIVKSNALELRQVVGGVDSLYYSTSGLFRPAYRLEVTFTFQSIDVSYNFGEAGFSISNATLPLFTGFTGFISMPGNTTLEVSNVTVVDWNEPMTTKELCKILLAYVGEHDSEIELESDESAQLDLVWGPQSDLDNPSKAFTQLLDSARIEAKWIPD